MEPKVEQVWINKFNNQYYINKIIKIEDNLIHTTCIQTNNKNYPNNILKWTHRELVTVNTYCPAYNTPLWRLLNGEDE